MTFMIPCNEKLQVPRMINNDDGAPCMINNLKDVMMIGNGEGEGT